MSDTVRIVEMGRDHEITALIGRSPAGRVAKCAERQGKALGEITVIGCRPAP